jgi:uncharacterized membrane-anchored protein
VLFWVIKVLTTGMGEAASDGLAKVNLFAAGLLGLLGFYFGLRWQLRSRGYHAVTYWFAVAMVAVFGTMCADGIHIVFRLPYVATTILWSVVLYVVFRRWYRSEGTLSIHSITTKRRELYYWATVLATFALGTATGDLTASTFKLGYAGSAALFAAAICVPLIGWRFFHLNAIVAFWTAYVLTRPLGASVADWLGKPKHFNGIHGGLGHGDGEVAAIAAVVIALLVAYVAIRRNDIQPPSAVGSDAAEARLYYHYADRATAQGIADRGVVEPAAVGSDAHRAARIPHVVWLTDADPATASHMLRGRYPLTQDDLVVLTVAVRAAIPWTAWARLHRVPRRIRTDVNASLGDMAGRWWVIESAIPHQDWVEMVDVASRERVWPDKVADTSGRAAPDLA